jgi:hypothetical protein
VAKVNTTTGELVRLIQRLYPLEITEETGQNMDEADQIKDSEHEPITQTVLRAVRTRSGRCVRVPGRYGY